jgi:hypothetical protein
MAVPPILWITCGARDPILWLLRFEACDGSRAIASELIRLKIGHRFDPQVSARHYLGALHHAAESDEQIHIGISLQIRDSISRKDHTFRQ